MRGLSGAHCVLWVSVEEDWNLGPNGTRLMSVATFARHESQSPRETVAFSLTVRCGKSISMMIRNPKSSHNNSYNPSSYSSYHHISVFGTFKKVLSSEWSWSWLYDMLDLIIIFLFILKAVYQSYLLKQMSPPPTPCSVWVYYENADIHSCRDAAVNPGRVPKKLINCHTQNRETLFPERWHDVQGIMPLGTERNIKSDAGLLCLCWHGTWWLMLSIWKQQLAGSVSLYDSFNYRF